MKQADGKHDDGQEGVAPVRWLGRGLKPNG